MCENIYTQNTLICVIVSPLEVIIMRETKSIEFKTEVNTKLDALKEVKEVTKENCYEIAKIKSVM